MANQRRLFDASCAHSRNHSVGHGVYGSGRRAARAAVPGQVRGQHVVAMARKVARWQYPNGVIHPSTVNKNNSLLPRLVDPSARVAEQDSLWGVKFHDACAPSTFLRCAQCPVEVFGQVIRIFQTDGQANQAF